MFARLAAADVLNEVAVLLENDMTLKKGAICKRFSSKHFSKLQKLK